MCTVTVRSGLRSGKVIWVGWWVGGGITNILLLIGWDVFRALFD